MNDTIHCGSFPLVRIPVRIIFILSSSVFCSICSFAYAGKHYCYRFEKEKRNACYNHCYGDRIVNNDGWLHYDYMLFIYKIIVKNVQKIIYILTASVFSLIIYKCSIEFIFIIVLVIFVIHICIISFNWTIHNIHCHSDWL